MIDNIALLAYKGLCAVSCSSEVNLTITLEDRFAGESARTERDDALDELAQYGEVKHFAGSDLTLSLTCNAGNALALVDYYRAGILEYISSVSMPAPFGRQYPLRKRTA